MKVYSYVPGGYAGDLVSVEVDIRRGIPTTDIVGLPDNAVREARERVRVALRKTGLEYPADRVLVNLAPAGVRKVGASFDLAIAVAVLESSGQLGGGVSTLPQNVLVVGELQLDGTVRPVSGVLSAVATACEQKISHIMVPADNVREAQALGHGVVEGVRTLRSAVETLRRGFGSTRAGETPPAAPGARAGAGAGGRPQFGQLRGHERFKRALEVAAAGRHNLIAVGPPGSGKTMGVRALPSIIPDLERDEAIEVTRIHSRAGLLNSDSGLFHRPPFRSPHHTASLQGVVGGGPHVLPGEISLAHRGILFLDEAAEFRKHVLQSLREPSEERRIVIARAGRTYWYPANFQLVLAANPCPCGYFGHPTRLCTCTMAEVSRYWKRLGGPLMDRVDARVRVDAAAVTRLYHEREEPEEAVRERVLEATKRQRFRYRRKTYQYNAEVPASTITYYLQPAAGAGKAVELAANKLSLSSRAVLSVFRMARTIADLEASDTTERTHLLEAIQHRRLGEGDPWF
ncbi:MAG: YifB family Mg chelatase-like AAA ATPase [Spirochaetota bacterium]